MHEDTIKVSDNRPDSGFSRSGQSDAASDVAGGPGLVRTRNDLPSYRDGRSGCVDQMYDNPHDAPGA